MALIAFLQFRSSALAAPPVACRTAEAGKHFLATPERGSAS
jgi:hypothetical protein